MPTVASYTVTMTSIDTLPAGTQVTNSFNFAVANFEPGGSLPDVLEDVQEELLDNGVNGRRWRRIHQQFTPFGLSTVADAASYATALMAARSYRWAKGKTGTLVITMDGVDYKYGKVKCIGVVPEVRKGVLVGNAALANSAAVIYARWQFVLSDVAKQGPNR